MKSLLSTLAAIVVCLWLLDAVSGLPPDNEFKRPALFAVGLLTVGLGLYLSYWFFSFAVRKNEEWIRSRGAPDAHTAGPDEDLTVRKVHSKVPWLNGIAASLALTAAILLVRNGLTQGTIAAAVSAALCGYAEWSRKAP